MKKRICLFYYISILILCFLPLPAFFLLYPVLDTSNRENRELAGPPVAELSRIQELPSQIEAYFTDHLPFKNQLATLQGLLDYHVFKSAVSGSVLVGKEGWLFYKGSQLNGEDPLADYQGANLFTEEELAQIRLRFQEAKEYLESRGTRLLVLLPPNKERVFSDQMPLLYGEVSEECRLSQTARTLKELGITVIEPLDALREAGADREGLPIYFRYDTHWTRPGAYLAASLLDEELGYSLPELDTVEMAKGEPFAEDLAIQIGLAGILKDDPIYNPYGFSPHQSQIVVNETLTEMDGHADTDGGNILLIGDSFSTLMFPYLACHYQNAHMVIYYDYDETYLDTYAPDVVVLEVVERYLGNLPRFSIHDGVERIFQEN